VSGVFAGFSRIGQPETEFSPIVISIGTYDDDSRHAVILKKFPKVLLDHTVLAARRMSHQQVAAVPNE
jgi:hypothetical protein